MLDLLHVSSIERVSVLLSETSVVGVLDVDAFAESVTLPLLFK